MSDNQQHDPDRTPLSRRRMMQLLGATGAAAGLAGCGGQSAVQTDTPDDGGDGGGDGGSDTDSGTPTQTATPVQVDSESLGTIQELAYVTNQTLPVLPCRRSWHSRSRRPTTGTSPGRIARRSSCTGRPSGCRARATGRRSRAPATTG
ncbi:hypothetical protein ACFQL4_07585 [Halosimplex aquaticum]